MGAAVKILSTVRPRHRTLRRHRAWRAGALLAAALVTLFLADLTPPYLREHPFPFFYAYALLAVWYGDGWDGLGAVILSAVACADVLPPDGSLSIAAPVDIVAEAVFTASSLLLVALVQRLRRAHTVAQAEIGERRRVEDALRASEGRLLAEHAAAEAARQVAEGALRVQDDFLATVSHELQTPLTAVGAGLGLLGMSASERLRPSERALLDNALRNAELLRRQISDLLTLNKVTAGALALDREALDLRAVAGEAAAAIHALVAAKGQTLDVDIPAPLPMRGDARRLGQALLNLLGNAHHHTPSGTHIRVAGRAVDGDVLLAVCDDGPGIPAGELERVFERFHRLGTDGGGAGLGLAIARGIVELHKGSLWAESVEWQGTTFHLRLPQDTVERAP